MKSGTELDKEIRKLLRDIFAYTGVGKEHANSAALRTTVEQFLIRIQQ